MKPSHAAFTLGSMILVLACAPAADMPAAQVDIEADRAAIVAVREAEGAAAIAGDVEAHLALMTSNVLVLQPNGEMVSGLPAARTWLEEFSSMFEISMTFYETDEILVSGDLAVERFSAEWTLTPKDGGEAVTERIKGVHVLARQADGSWKISHDVWNSDTPLAEGM